MDLRKIRHIKQIKSTQAHKQMVVKIQKKEFLLYFDPVAKVWVLINRVENTLLQFFSSSLYLFGTIFSGIAWIDKQLDFDD